MTVMDQDRSCGPSFDRAHVHLLSKRSYRGPHFHVYWMDHGHPTQLVARCPSGWRSPVSETYCEDGPRHPSVAIRGTGFMCALFGDPM